MNRVYAAETMLRRETGQILPGLIMLMLAILALGTLTFQIGNAAVLRSGAQTAADAAALAGARSVRDQLIAQVAATGTSDFARVSEAVARAAAADYAERNGGRLTDFKMEGADVRAFVDTDEEKIDPPKDERRGIARARARVELVPFSPSVGGVPGGGPLGPLGGDTTITDEEWKELGKELNQPPGCEDVLKLGQFLKAHGAIPPYENSELGDPPMPPGGEREDTSYHYKCGGGSGAIDLNYAGNEFAIIERVKPEVEKLGFHTIWQTTNHYDHMHIDYANSPSSVGGGAAGPLQDTFLEVKLVDWDAPSPLGLGANYVGGAGGIPFGPPDPRIANALCQELDRFNVSAKVRLAAWETAIVESGVKIPPTNDGDSLGPFQQRPSWGSASQRLDGHYAAAAFIRAAEKIEDGYSDPGVLAQAVQGSDYPDRYGQRAGQAAALDKKFCGT